VDVYVSTDNNRPMTYMFQAPFLRSVGREPPGAIFSGMSSYFEVRANTYHIWVTEAATRQT